MSKQFHSGVEAIASCLSINITPVISLWNDIYTKRRKTRGKNDAVKFMKELNTVVERYAMYQPITAIPWTKSDKDGYPKILNAVKPYLRSEDVNTVMLTLSVFRTVETLRLPISKDISTVTEVANFDNDTVEAIINFIPRFLKGIKPLKFPELKYHISLKNGPNGQALRSSDLDTHAVSSDPQLRKAIRVVEEKLNDRYRMEVRGPERDDLIHSKLVQFPEKSGKTRTIAIIDYYSQRCLKPLHEGLMKTLRALKADGTYSHNRVGQFAKKLTNTKSYAYCADLSAFTDRFPAVIQEHLLLQLVEDSDLATAWWTLLAKRTFTVAWSGDSVKYEAGQPMGAYASWALCSLAHHLTVQYAAYCGYVKGARTKYRLIGDDLIVSDQVIAENYRDIISKLDVSINVGKTVESIPNNHSCAEVAKQIYLDGNCLTPLTPGIVRDLKKPYMFNTCLGIIKERYNFDPDVFPMLIEKFFSKEQQELVWILATEPEDGAIKPGMPGYDEHCPWLQLNVADYKARRIGYAFSRITSRAEDLYYDLIEYLKFGEGPLEDLASSQTVSFAAKRSLIELRPKMDRLNQWEYEVHTSEDLERLSEEFAFLPDPRLPFMSRQELRRKRLSSIVEYVYRTMC